MNQRPGAVPGGGARATAPSSTHERAGIWVALLAIFALLPVLAPAAAALREVVTDPGAAFGALADGLLWTRLARTLGLALFGLGLALAVGLTQAWLFVRTDLPGRRWLASMAPLPLFLPPLVHVLAWFGALGIKGAPAIVLVTAVSYAPLVMLLAARTLEQVGRSHAEQLQLLGGPRAVLRDDVRQAIPAGLVGAALGLVFVLSDFAVADFVTSVGPKVTVYGDSLYAHHLALDGPAAAGSALPGLLIGLFVLWWALRRRERLGASVGGRFARAAPLVLGRWRGPATALAFVLTGAGTVFPFLSLAYRTGSFSVLVAQAREALHPLLNSLMTALAAAAAMVVMATALSLLRRQLARPRWLDLLVFVPLALPALLYGIGLVRIFNRPGFDAFYLGQGIVVLALVGRYLAFAYLPLGGALERLGPGMHEAARLSGAGPWSRFWSLLLPYLRPTVGAAFCLCACFTLRELDTLIMLRAGQDSLTFHLYARVVFARQDEVAALALLLASVTLLPLGAYLLLTRRSLRLS